MDWFSLVLGVVLGSCVTSVLLWMLRPRSIPQSRTAGLFGMVALSVLLTAILGGLTRTGLEFAATGLVTMTGVVFGSGWVLGGLIAAWLIAGPRRPA